VDAEETALLRAMSSEAQEYVTSFSWCPPIKTLSLAFGIGGIVAVFLVELEKPVGETDKLLWVVVGDIPSAYLVVDDGTNPMSALRRYCGLMEDWANAVINQADLESVFPVQAHASYDNAKDLLKRIAFIRSEVLTHP